MRRYLVVANQTLAGRHLLDAVGQRIRAGPARFHILVPATPSQHHLTWTEGEARAIAAERLDHAIFELRDLGAEVTGEIGDEAPLQAILDVVRHQEFDEILLSTLPPGPSRWLGQDLPRRAHRATGLPVVHLVAEPQDVL